MKPQTKRILRGMILGFPASWFMFLTMAYAGLGGAVMMMLFFMSWTELSRGMEAMGPDCEGCHSHRADCVFRGEVNGETV